MGAPLATDSIQKAEMGHFIFFFVPTVVKDLSPFAQHTLQLWNKMSPPGSVFEQTA